MSSPAPNATRRLPVTGSDLLLILILGLGSSRLVLPLLAAGLGISALDPQARMGAILILLAAQTGLLLAVVYLIAVRWRGCTWAELGFVPLPPGWGTRAAAIALVSFPLIGGVNWVQQQITGQPFENPQLQVLAPADFSWAAYLGTLAVAGLWAPFVEEIVFRGLLFRWLGERYGFTLALVGSALAFAVLHGIPALIPAIVVLGAILAWIYARTQSIWAPVIVHGAYNAVVTTILYAAVAQGLSPQGL